VSNKRTASRLSNLAAVAAMFAGGVVAAAARTRAGAKHHDGET
jgi:hypothetical protein